MDTLTFKESLALSQVSEDTFQNVHEPWTWPFSLDTIPGGLLMSEAAAAAYKTVPKDFALDSLQTHFIGKPTPSLPMVFKVARLSNGRRFIIRAVEMKQNDVLLLHVTLSFVNTAPWNGPAMRYSVSRKTTGVVSEIILDDLELGRGRNRLGSFMKFQRLPLVFQDASKAPETGITTSVAQIIPPIQDDADAVTHVLGIINLSDYHVMDTAMQLNDITFGLPAIDDNSQTPTKNYSKFGTSLNHSIHFHRHDGFRADELTYIEVESSWSKDGRAMLSSKIFTKDGLLIATCIQEAFYVLKDSVKTDRAAKI